MAQKARFFTWLVLKPSQNEPRLPKPKPKPAPCLFKSHFPNVDCLSQACLGKSSLVINVTKPRPS